MSDRDGFNNAMPNSGSDTEEEEFKGFDNLEPTIEVVTSRPQNPIRLHLQMLSQRFRNLLRSPMSPASSEEEIFMECETVRDENNDGSSSDDSSEMVTVREDSSKEHMNGNGEVEVGESSSAFYGRVEHPQENVSQALVSATENLSLGEGSSGAFGSEDSVRLNEACGNVERAQDSDEGLEEDLGVTDTLDSELEDSSLEDKSSLEDDQILEKEMQELVQDEVVTQYQDLTEDIEDTGADNQNSELEVQERVMEREQVTLSPDNTMPEQANTNQLIDFEDLHVVALEVKEDNVPKVEDAIIKVRDSKQKTDQRSEQVPDSEASKYSEDAKDYEAEINQPNHSRETEIQDSNEMIVQSTVNMEDVETTTKQCSNSEKNSDDEPSLDATQENIK